MPFTLGTVVTAARDRHAAFHPTRVPNGLLARYLTDLQNDLIARAASSEPTYLAQVATIALDLNTADTVSVAGAGTSGGLPGTVDADGNVQTSVEPTGALVTMGLSAEDGASVVVSDRVVTDAIDISTTSAGAGRTVDADVGRVLVITAGKGQGQVREITSNTATIWTHAPWSATPGWVTPDTTSVMSVVVPSYDATEAASVVTALPAQSARSGYLVKLTDAGVPYIDLATPILTTVDVGVPLPAMQTLLGGTIRYTDGSTDDLTVTSYARRSDPTRTLAVYPMGETVQLIGTAEDWADVASLELRYTPIAPTFTALTDLFLLPDAARSTVVASCAAFMALRVAGTEGVSIDPAAYQAMANTAESTYLSSVRLMSRARHSVMRGQD